MFTLLKIKEASKEWQKKINLGIQIVVRIKISPFRKIWRKKVHKYWKSNGKKSNAYRAGFAIFILSAASYPFPELSFHGGEPQLFQISVDIVDLIGANKKGAWCKIGATNDREGILTVFVNTRYRWDQEHEPKILWNQIILKFIMFIQLL